MELETKFHDCFRTDKRFEDKVHFPYGFLKSGEFTIEQAGLLDLKGNAYQELATGLRKPRGEAEREFVAFCSGKKQAETVHERLWQRYQSKVTAASNTVSFNKKRLSQSVLSEEEM
ncbi:MULTISPECIES: DUF413 domain-containing protein [unclassified Neptuniibacter]|uniref:DUF413 domain-containing protein n=1 Tax=unclassified Neptuniibacter TaxID=2630693 RepID=UPI000C48A570|nr:MULTISPECIES: DUF413 domain-containing protein [unclassified Neptuniibacter]MAY43543.1 hypothetical protein [Oceanospirillaceae bacterium]|tara:strand:- start:6109 stop:6456 length:348 start_codon:yes stop_codon:yes gene_type:complete